MLFEEVYNINMSCRLDNFCDSYGKPAKNVRSKVEMGYLVQEYWSYRKKGVFFLSKDDIEAINFLSEKGLTTRKKAQFMRDSAGEYDFLMWDGNCTKIIHCKTDC